MRSQYGDIPSNSSSPDRRTGQNSLMVSMQINHKNDVESIFKVETSEMALGIDWIQQLDFKQSDKRAKQKVQQVADTIISKTTETLKIALTISFDSFGIFNQKEYMKQNYQNLNETLKILKRMNNGLSLQQIRREEADNPNRTFVELKHLKLSAIGWKQVTLQDQIQFVQKTALAQRITINLQGTYISTKLIQSLKAMIKNNQGQYKQIEVNLSGCPNANSQMLLSLLQTQSYPTPKVIKLRFMDWGKSIQKYFGPDTKNDHYESEIRITHSKIKALADKLAANKIQAILDFRGWDKKFKLSEIEEATNSKKQNVQSLGVFSKTKRTKKDQQFNLIFMA